MARKLIVEIVGDTKSLERSLATANREVNTFGRRTQTAVASIGRSLAFGGIAAGITALVGTLKVGVDEFAEQEKVAAQTAAVLKSTGNVANVTARELEGLANSLSRLSGVDDELIQRGGNLLLTFKNVRDEVGKGNDIFKRATTAALDLSVAGFGSVESTAKQLGKALNDPIRGMTALGRAGVTFTKAQRDQITALVESNRLLDAQKLILQEVESQVGGSAAALGKTLPGSLNRLRNAFEELAGSAIAALAPSIERAAKAVTQYLERAQQTGDVQRRVNATLRDVRSVFDGVRAVVVPLAAAVKRLTDVFGGLEDSVRLLMSAIVVAKLSGLARSIGLLGTSAETSTGKVRGLGGALRALPKSTPILIALTVTENFADRIRSSPKVRKRLEELAREQGLRPDLGGHPDEGTRGLEIEVKAEIDKTDSLTTSTNKLGEARKKLAAAQKKAGEKRAEIAARFLDTLRLGLEKAELTATLRDDLAALDNLEAGVRQQIASAGRTNDLERQLLDIARQRSSIAQQQREALERAKEERKRARDALQFKALGLTATGQERVPGVEALRRQLTNITGALEGTFLDTNKTQSLLAKIRRVLSGGLGAVSQDVRSKVAELIADLKRQLEDFGRAGPKTLSKALDVSEALKGLSGSQEALARARQALAGAVVPVRATGQPVAAAGGAAFVVHTYVDLDGQRVATNTTKHQERDSQRTAPARRG